MNKFEKFKKVLADNDEIFFPTGDDEYDLNYVEGLIAHQGYWAGGNKRYFFDKDMNLVKTEERRFGS